MTTRTSIQAMSVPLVAVHGSRLTTFPTLPLDQLALLKSHATVDTRLIGLPGVLDLRSRQP